ncbi:MAG: hypothetical protein CFH38_01154 [Alphaproteobacteria bacterium MarineAlpha10_Bin1]|nr:MAG: hypothetical protein CFH38_01154 [Alphaproteobacteria bacterium MarineAlpha10_Bin1]
MIKRKLLSRSAFLVLPIALAVAGCQTAPADSGSAASSGALETAQSAKQGAMNNQTSITLLRGEIASLRDAVMKSGEASERAASAAERAAEEAKAAADKADRIFQRQMRK